MTYDLCLTVIYILLSITNNFYNTQLVHKSKMNQQFRLNPVVKQNLSRLVKYDKRSFANLSINNLKGPLSEQATEIQSKHSGRQRNPYNNQQLLILVLNNHVRAIIDLRSLDIPAEQNVQSRRSFNDRTTIADLEDIAKQFTGTDSQINRIVLINKDYEAASQIIKKTIDQCSRPNNKHRNNNFVKSRITILKVLLGLLPTSTVNGQPETIPEKVPGLRRQGISVRQLDENDVKIVIQQIDAKVAELSSICQQIPQLEQFKRTLDLTMQEHHQNFTRIVDVLIQLHHQINKLTSRRPERLLKQIEAVQKQCLIIQSATLEFINQLESESENVQIKAIYFNQKANKSPDYFRRIQQNVVKMSQHIIYCLNLQTQCQQKMVQMTKTVQIFLNLVSGMEDYERQWAEYRNRQKSQQEQKIIQVLDECLRIVYENRQEIQKMKKEYEQKLEMYEKQKLSGVGYLQEQINKLSRENQDLKSLIKQLEDDRHTIRHQLTQYKQKYTIIIRKQQQQANQQKNNQNTNQRKQKAFRDRIESLQSDNEQKRIMIANITNDLKRAMRESESIIKLEQKNRQLQDELNLLRREKQSLTERDNQNQLNKKQLIRLEANNGLLIEKLDAAKKRMEQAQAEASRLRRELDQARRNASETLGQKQKELHETMIEKDSKILELNNKIGQLNNKLSGMLIDFKNMQSQLKRKQQAQIDLNRKIHDIQIKLNDPSVSRSKTELVNALNELQKTNRIVKDLEEQIRRREKIISDRQIIITELQDKITGMNRKIDEANSQINIYIKKNQDAEIGFNRKESQLRNRISELQSQLRNSTSQNDRTRDLQDQVNRKDREIQDLRNQINRLQVTISQGHSNNQEKIRGLKNEIEELNQMIRGVQNNKDHVIRDLQAQLSELNNQLTNMTRQRDILEEKIRGIQNNIRKNANNQEKIKQLQAQLNQFKNSLTTSNTQNDDLLRKIRDLQALSSASKINENRIKDLQREITNLRQDNDHLRNTIQSLQKETFRRDQHIRELQVKAQNKSRVAELQNQIRQLNITIDSLKLDLEKANQNNRNHDSQHKKKLQKLNSKIHELEKQLSLKDRELKKLQNSAVSDQRVKEYERQIQYLRQKVRSFEQLVEVFTQQHAILQAKIKQYRLKEGRASQINIKFDNISQEIIEYKSKLAEKDSEIANLKLKISQVQQQYSDITPIKRLDQDNSQVQRQIQRANAAQIQLKNLQKKHSELNDKYSNQTRTWLNKESQYVNEINTLKSRSEILDKSQFNTSRETEVDQTKYYLRIQGEKLEDLIRKMEDGSFHLNQKVDEILSNSRRRDGTISNSQITENIGLEELVAQNKILIEQIKKQVQQKKQFEQIIKKYPNPDHLTVFVSNVITFFSQLVPEDSAAIAIWEKLQSIRQQFEGIQYFVVLQQFTKKALQQNAIEIYRRELKIKADELEIIKAKFNKFFESELESQEKILNRSYISESRLKLFEEKNEKVIHKLGGREVIKK